MARRHVLWLLTIALGACPGPAPVGSGLTGESSDTTGATPEPGDSLDTTAASTDARDTTTAASSDGAEAGHAASGPDTTATDTTDGQPQSVCGNGVLEDSLPTPEECDDGNLIPDDGCNATCAADRRVFVSSILYKAGEIKSLYLADAKCANMAVQVGFAEPLKFRAWLSDSDTDAALHIRFGRGRIVLVNGLVVADSWLHLITGEMQNPIDVTEKSETYHGGVWTGTRPDGTRVPGATHCLDWTSNSANQLGYYGYSDRTTPEWTLSALDDNPIFCLADFALYCFEEI